MSCNENKSAFIKRFFVLDRKSYSAQIDYSSKFQPIDKTIFSDCKALLIAVVIYCSAICLSFWFICSNPFLVLLSSCFAKMGTSIPVNFSL